MFGSGFSGSLSFASVAKASSGSIFDPVNIQKAKAEFDAQAKSKAGFLSLLYRDWSGPVDLPCPFQPFTEPKDKSAASDAKGKGDSGDGEGEGGADEEYEPDVHFAPVIPLPDLVDVVTGEEEEQVHKFACSLAFVISVSLYKERSGDEVLSFSVYYGQIMLFVNFPQQNGETTALGRSALHGTNF